MAIACDRIRPNQRTPRLLPRFGHTVNGEHKGWLYVLGTADGLVKIGKSASPSRRLVQHQTALGASLEWFHLGPGCEVDRIYSAEQHAIEMLQQVGVRIGRSEWFRGVDRAQGIAAIRSAVCAQLSALQVAPGARTANAPRKADRHRCATG